MTRCDEEGRDEGNGGVKANVTVNSENTRGERVFYARFESWSEQTLWLD